ncbi:MAG: hypothetical protein ACOH2H_13445 [Cypionkella sp.]
MLNDLAETRAELLRLLFPGRRGTRFAAAQIDDHLDLGIRPSVILMDPPFSAVANVDGHTFEASARHICPALARLALSGRLVAITGERRAGLYLNPQEPCDRRWTRWR